ncbi:DUF2919 family protein [Ningiella sp. W23]|uniref:DUF2919 family protein n=1 Tax=Ningiella sp. W23 TaxID=3023715 RepID=UPI00375844FC
MLYLFLIFLCRGFLILIISLSFREDSSRMMSIFFPNKWDFYWSLLPAIPAIAVFALLAQRSRIFKAEKQRYFTLIPWLFFIGLVIDTMIQSKIIIRMDFGFSLAHGLSILIACIGIGYGAQSRHMRDLPSDWQRT